MPLTNYTELQTAVADWAHRSDLTTVMPDLIKLGESYLNRSLRTKAQETTSNLTADTLTNVLAFPTRMLELMDVSIVVDGETQKLQQVGYENLLDIIRSDSGQPCAYAVTSQLEFDCVPDQAYTVKVHMYQTLDLATDTTNYVLTNYPDAYLYATMAALNVYIKADPSFYLNAMQAVIKDINRNEARSKSMTLITDVPRSYETFDVRVG